MILYINEDRKYKAEEFNKLYKSNIDYFGPQIAKKIKPLLKILLDNLNIHEEFNCLDIGCSQGKILNIIDNYIRQKTSNLNLYGIDANEIAIKQANMKFDKYLYYIDEIYEFFKNDRLKSDILFDMIINRGGLNTDNITKKRYQFIINNINHKLSDMGIYCYIISNDYYKIYEYKIIRDIFNNSIHHYYKNMHFIYGVKNREYIYQLNNVSYNWLNVKTSKIDEYLLTINPINRSISNKPQHVDVEDWIIEDKWV